MAEKAEKEIFLEKFRHKYRYPFIVNETYEEVLNFRLTRLNVMAMVGAGFHFFLVAGHIGYCLYSRQGG